MSIATSIVRSIARSIVRSVEGVGAAITRFIFQLLNSTTSRLSTRSVSGYKSDDVLYGADDAYSVTVGNWTDNGDGTYTYDGLSGTSAISFVTSGLSVGETAEVSFTVVSNTGSGTNPIDFETSGARLSNVHLDAGDYTFTGVVDGTTCLLYGRASEPLTITAPVIRTVTQESLLTVPSNLGAYPGARLATTAEDGAVLGSDLKTTLTAGTNWTLNGDGSITHTPGSVSSSYYLGILSDQATYKTEVVISGSTTGTIQVKYGATVGTNLSGNGTFTEEGAWTTGSGDSLYISPSSTFDGTVTVNYVKEVTPTWYTTLPEFTATTVADGAVLGDEEVDLITTAPSAYQGTAAVDDASTTTLTATVANDSRVSIQQATTVGEVIRVSGTVPNVDVGTVLIAYNETSGAPSFSTATIIDTVSSGGTFDFEVTATNLLFNLVFKNTGHQIGDTFTTTTSIKQVIPTNIGSVSVPNYRGQSIADSTINKCQCVKANPTDTTGLTKSGDAAATLTVVDDSAELALAGLDGICTSGNVYKLDNSGGATSASATITGLTGNTNDHAIQVFARCSTAQQTSNKVLMSVSPFTGTTINSSVPYAGYEVLLTAPSASSQAAVQAVGGAIIYFILPGLYESATVPSSAPVIGDDTAATASAAADVVTIPTPSVLSAESGAIEIVCTPDETGQLTKYILDSTVTDFQDQLLLYTSATTIIFGKRVAGVFEGGVLPIAYTHTKDQEMVVRIYWDSAIGMGITAADSIATLPAFATNANTVPAQFAETISVCNRGGTSIFKSTVAPQITFYASKEAAGW